MADTARPRPDNDTRLVQRTRGTPAEPGQRDTDIADTTPSTSDRRARLRHHGAAGELFKIYVVNILLTLVTLGIYRFWAKTRVRRYV